MTTTSPTFDVVQIGDELPPLDIALTRTLIVAGAIASRDYQEVHHDPDLARERGSKDIIMNILTTNGYVGRFVTDWAGPDAVITLGEGAPRCSQLPGRHDAHDGRRSARVTRRRGAITIDVTGANSLGNHVVATVEVTLP